MGTLSGSVNPDAQGGWGWRALLVLAVVWVVVVDQTTKAWAVAAFSEPRQAINVLPGLLDLQLALNRGPAFGFWQGTTLNVVPALVALVGALGLSGAALQIATASRRRLSVVLGLLCGGLAANLADWLLRGEVVDFVRFRYNTFQLPRCNLATVATTMGAGLFFLRSSWDGPSGEWRRYKWFWSSPSVRGFAGATLRLATLPLFLVGGVLLGQIWHGDVAWPALGVLLIYIAANTQHFARRLQQPGADELMELDRRSPVLLLRAFRRDHQPIPVPRRRLWHYVVWPQLYILDRTPRTFEDELIRRAASIGPPVAVGRPGETIQPAGASRTYFTDDEWQDGVRALALRAKLVIVIVDETDGLGWELEQLPQCPGLEKVLLVLPPGRGREWYDGWMRLRQRASYLPAVTDSVAAVRFDSSLQPVLISAASAAAWDELSAIAGALA